MKPHWSKAPERVREQIETVRRFGAEVPMASGGSRPSAARSFVAAMSAAYQRGYAYDAPETPLLDQLARVSASGNRFELNEFMRCNAIEIEEERKAKLRHDALERWRGEPSNEEQAAEAKKKRDAEARERAIEERAQQLIVTEDAKRLEAARAKARKELEVKNA
jgi:hypothetical protein